MAAVVVDGHSPQWVSSYAIGIATGGPASDSSTEVLVAAAGGDAAVLDAARRHIMDTTALDLATQVRAYTLVSRALTRILGPEAAGTRQVRAWRAADTHPRHPLVAAHVSTSAAS